MKKIFTLLAFLVVTANAAAQTPLNVGDPELSGFNANEEANINKGVIEQGRLNICGYIISAHSTSMNWFGNVAIQNTNSLNWIKTGLFKGSTYFYTTGPESAVNFEGTGVYRTATFYINNCKQIDLYLYRGSKAVYTRGNYQNNLFKITATPSGESSGQVEQLEVEMSAKSTAFFPSLSLDHNKSYKIDLQIPGNTYLHEISFLVNNFQPTVANINGNNWGTMYLDFPVRIPKNEHSTLHAYTIEGIGDNNKVTLGEVSNYIPANTGVLLWEEEPNDKPIIFTETGKNIAEISENWLKGTTADNFTVGDALDGKPSTAKVLTLGRSGGKLGFFIYNGSLGKNKAYLLYDYGADSPINVKGFYISGFDDMTDIQTVESESTETGNWYSLQGVRLNARPMQRGIYLNNGKKVFVK